MTNTTPDFETAFDDEHQTKTVARLTKLQTKLEKKRSTMEYNTVTINGVSNLSRSDVDMAIDLIDDIVAMGEQPDSLMYSGSIKTLIDKAI